MKSKFNLGDTVWVRLCGLDSGINLRSGIVSLVEEVDDGIEYVIKYRNPIPDFTCSSILRKESYVFANEVNAAVFYLKETLENIDEERKNINILLDFLINNVKEDNND